MADPSTETWRAALGQSTSAQLRQTQRDLAASQADLTHVERQLREAEDERLVAEARFHDALGDAEALTLLNAELKAEASSWRETAERHLANLDETARELATARYQNRILTAENEAALRALNELKERHD